MLYFLQNEHEVVGTRQYEEIECSMVFRSIRFKNKPIDRSVPFDYQLGIIPNKNGRVIDLQRRIVRGKYF